MLSCNPVSYPLWYKTGLQETQLRRDVTLQDSVCTVVWTSSLRMEYLMRFA